MALVRRGTDHRVAARAGPTLTGVRLEARVAPGAGGAIFGGIRHRGAAARNTRGFPARIGAGWTRSPAAPTVGGGAEADTGVATAAGGGTARHTAGGPGIAGVVPATLAPAERSTGSGWMIGTAGGVAQPLAMRSITGTLTLRCCSFSKRGIAEVGAGAGTGPGYPTSRANKQPTQGRCHDRLERLSPRDGPCQVAGQLVKAVIFHALLLFAQSAQHTAGRSHTPWGFAFRVAIIHPLSMASRVSVLLSGIRVANRYSRSCRFPAPRVRSEAR